MSCWTLGTWSQSGPSIKTFSEEEADQNTVGAYKATADSAEGDRQTTKDAAVVVLEAKPSCRVITYSLNNDLKEPLKFLKKHWLMNRRKGHHPSCPQEDVWKC